MTIQRNAASFRDPSGFVYRKDGKLCRAVTAHGRSDFALFVNSGLAAKLMEERKIVPFNVQPGGDGIELEELGFIAYPYEWSFGQLREAPPHTPPKGCAPFGFRTRAEWPWTRRSALTRSASYRRCGTQ